MGLIKLDILALNYLTVLAKARELIQENHKVTIDFESLDLEDKEVLEYINRGNTAGLFQIGTKAMRSLIGDMGVENFSLLSDAIALVRPGPHDSGMTDDFIKRKKGAAWKRKHPIYEKITQDTFGIVVYQEQVMAVINKVAGLPWETADKIRKIIGKKRNAKEFMPFKKAFIEGCQRMNTLSVQEADEFWHAMENHARYSFNRSHSVAYAMIGYWTAWVKFHYLTEFISASLTFGNEKNKDGMIEEACRFGLKLMPPKIGKSNYFEWAAKDKRLYIPFIELRGFGGSSIQELHEAVKRMGDGISSFFGKKLKKPALSKKVSAILEAVDAFDDGVISRRKAIEIRDSFKSFTYPIPVEDANPNLIALADGALAPAVLPLALIGQYRIAKNLIKPATFERDVDLLRCSCCDLRGECRRPVMPSPGQINVMILGDSPGPNEDRIGEGFVGASGDLLWGSLKPFRLGRQLFHVSNVCKCYPSTQRQLSPENIQACSAWLQAELEAINCRIVLAFGNSAVKFFTGVQTGITELSGKTDWIDEYSTYVCWCIHPAHLLRNPKKQKANYKRGITNFVNTLKKLR